MSNAQALCRVVWKEYRQQRAFWLALAGLMVFVQLLIIGFSTHADDNPRENMLAVAFVGAALYALGCGSMLFAAEHENDTYDFQRSLPAAARWLISGKTVYALLSTAGMLAFLLGTYFLLGLLGGGWHHQSFAVPSAKEVKNIVGVAGLAIFEMWAWGIFFSLLLKRPLPAALLAVAGASASLHPFYYFYGIYSEFWKNYFCIIPQRLLVLAAVIAADVWLGARWLREESWLTRRRNRLGMGALPRKRISPTGRGRRPFSRASLFGRLCWQQYRRSFGIVTAIAVLFPLAVTAAVFHLEKISAVFEWIPPTGVVLAVLLWSMMFFRDDQSQKKFRFLTDRGVPPNWIWLSRQVWGFLPVLMIAVIYALGHSLIFLGAIYFNIIRMPQVARIQPTLENLFHVSGEKLYWIYMGSWGLFLSLLIIFCVVQFCSLFFRSGILAGFFSLVLSGVLVLWSLLMVESAVPWWWSVAPLPAIFLLATWLRMPGWLLERKGIHAWLRPAIALLPLAAIIIAVPFYRVYSVPWVAPEIPESEFTRRPTPEALETVALYRQASKEYQPFPKQEHPENPGEKLDITPLGEPPPLTLEERDWLASNQKALELILEASRRPECAPGREDSSPPAFTSSRFNPTRLQVLLIYHARQLQTEGRPAEAWEYYLAALRLADHWKSIDPWGNVSLQVHFKRRVLLQLPYWAAGDQVTSGDIRKALEDVRHQTVSPEIVRESLIREYLFSRKLIQGIAEYPGQLHSSVFWFYRNVLFWERLRAERLLNVFLHSKLQILKHWEYLLKNKEQLIKPIIEVPPMPFPFNIFFDHPYSWLEGDIWIEFVTLHRAVEIQLAMVAWKKEHGEYPADLAQVAEYFGEKIPRDPYSGEPFGYVPKGFCHSQVIQVTADLWKPELRTLEAGRPFLWSMGTRIHLNKKNGPRWQDRYFIGNDYYQPKAEQELWANGICFPLP